MLLDPLQSTILIVDVQTRLLPAMQEPQRVLARSSILLKVAETLQIPVTVSEQYSKGLGRTVPELANNTATVFEKITFSCWRDAAMRKHFMQIHDGGRPLVIVAGIEAHVCVLQTCIDLYASGFGVFAVSDAMSSRDPSSAGT